MENFNRSTDKNATHCANPGPHCSCALCTGRRVLISEGVWAAYKTAEANALHLLPTLSDKEKIGYRNAIAVSAMLSCFSEMTDARLTDADAMRKMWSELSDVCFSIERFNIGAK
jgi:hypothetical protein